MRTAGALGGGGLLIALIYAFLSGDPGVLLDQMSPDAGVAPQVAGEAPSTGDDGKEMISVILADTEDFWNQAFAARSQSYAEPALVLFNGSVASACGTASSAVGPFYCPSDRQVYLDLGFFAELSGRLGASGDFAQAYVVAHEVGHHVQNLLGTMDHVQQQQENASKAEANRLSVRLELQADCFAGLWAKATQLEKNVLEAGDREEALAAASAVGDDRLQMQAQGHVVPDSFTHGSAEQRVRWFSRGFAVAEPTARSALEACDTFAATELF